MLYTTNRHTTTTTTTTTTINTTIIASSSSSIAPLPAMQSIEPSSYFVSSLTSFK